MSRSKFGQSSRVLSGRDARRYAQREQKKEQRKQELARWNAMTPEQRRAIVKENETLSRLERNGITIEDMTRLERDSYDEGLHRGRDETVRTCFAAICLALNERYGFGKKRCSDVLNDTYEKLMYALTSSEAIQEVYDRIGLEIRFTDDVMEEVVQEKEARK